ncbi:MAG: N-acetyltransferase [Opitutaceae bacterium]|jgi:L-amino acid N-acyltransferase YncA|nr:N-acetyltransferase [Opitutaceae bacterium]
MTPSLRPATAGDIPAIQAIYAHHVLHGTGTFETEPPTVGSMQHRFQEIIGKGYPYLVAETEEGVIGFGYLGPFRTRPAYRYTVEDSIYLHPDKRGQRVGSKLLVALIEEATQKGFTQMVALIGDSNNRASVALHARCGFESTGTMRQVGFKFDRWLDVVIMQRSLGQ